MPDLRFFLLAHRSIEAAAGGAPCKSGGDEVKYRKSLEL
jgi:hypothetical protein